MGPSEKIDTVPELLAHALAIEEEARERYGELAEQMEMHHNAEAADFFRMMAKAEAAHCEMIVRRAEGMTLPHIAPWEYRWQGAEPPESVDVGEVSYLMTRHHALWLALRAEEQGLAFFSRIVETADDPEVLAIAGELAEEEREHVALVKKLLAGSPAPEAGWDDDPDPPVLGD